MLAEASWSNVSREASGVPTWEGLEMADDQDDQVGDDVDDQDQDQVEQLEQRPLLGKG
jgi:hypothetical protein